MKIIFVLPGRGGGGGTHSVVQETLGLHRIGISASIATTTETAGAFGLLYPELEAAGLKALEFEGSDGLAAVIAGSDMVIATTAASAQLLADSLRRLGSEGGRVPRPAYYIQDYEPLFFAPGSAAWKAAWSSYSALPDALLFAKTSWLCEMVASNHGLKVQKVRASLDHDLYYPDMGISRSGPVRIAAMIRASTPRRAPHRTARIMARLAEVHGDRVVLTSFGSQPDELQRRGLELSHRIDHRGVLDRGQVADVLRASDLFLDLSDYQAFGRTALEGMACSCVPVLPLFGGASEYAKDRWNGFVVDTRSDEAIMAAVADFLTCSPESRNDLRHNALSTALTYSVAQSAYSEAVLFARALQ